MLRLGTIFSILIFLFVMLIGAAMALGRAMPLPEEVAFLHLGDMCELPCWIGITPGKTTVGEGRAIIAKVYGRERALISDPARNLSVTVTATNGTQLRIGLYDNYYNDIYSVGDSFNDNQLINLISLRPASGAKIPIGYAISALGTPEIVFTNINDQQIKLVNQWFQIYSPIRQDKKLNFNDTISTKHPLDRIYLSAKNGEELLTDEQHRWRGFGIYEFTYLVPSIDCSCAD